ncbi:Protein N-acetyltransferase, RimJ/RimL family [Dyella jiangningensis]|uniref:GNAT family N-acetyltransferase n=1 Tax=Dyella sp. AtDHG13 TaxID=1938897 RepID=UPI00088E7893|nr:GNAT family N-acetyltransferase [Dyella sp. AtDHG13]PXV60400.1 RimJ/RimL family protein N-acetyltransferase [Dyella sp. AtDHG13]SDJ44004.1 Protein N-acetyltransferase, RimJ/RimL family [Dyella jiangningensis]
MADTTCSPIPLELDAQGIRLRPWRADDADALFEAARESFATVSPWMPWLHAGYTRDDSAGWIAACQAGRERGDAYTFGIFDSSGRVLGDIGLNRVDPKRGSANLGYWVRESAQGHGVATRAGRAIAAFGFQALELVRIEIVAAVDNVASRRTAETLGAHFDGISPNRTLLHGAAAPAAVYSLLPPEHGDTSPGPVLEDGALRLRPLRPADLPALYASLHESMDSIGRWQPWCTPKYSLQDGARWITQTRLAWQGIGDECALAIADRTTDELIGSIALNHWQPEYGMANLGYWVRQSRQEQGIATAAVRTLARHALRATELRRLEIVIAEDNLASRRVAEKAGAMFEAIARRRLLLRGEPQDAAVYSFIADDLR